MKKRYLFMMVMISLLICSACGKKEEKSNNLEKDNIDDTPVVTEKITIIDEESNSRPYAVMVNNYPGAVKVQTGLSDAYLIYEMPVEGGMSRSLALFKDKTTSKIGTVRSARHNFLDYVMENDALYAHYGCSYIAESDIPALGINNINGMVESSTYWRDNTRNAPHNALTSTEKLLAAANRKGYRTTSDKKSVLNYTADEVLLENGQAATTITIPYSSYNTVKYTYNEETKTYTRYSKGKKQTEWVTGKDVTTKNIIITFAKNYTVSGSDKLQELENKGTLKGYYITNGKAIEITCEKSDRASQTVYKDLQGNEIKVNDGNTFVQICPINANVTLE